MALNDGSSYISNEGSSPTALYLFSINCLTDRWLYGTQLEDALYRNEIINMNLPEWLWFWDLDEKLYKNQISKEDATELVKRRLNNGNLESSGKR